MSSKTFTANGRLENFSTEDNSETFVYLGLVDENGADVSVNFGSGTITIGMRASDSTDSTNVIPLKTITTLDL